MKKFKLVPILLIISLVSFFMFVVGGVAINHVSKKYEKALKKNDRLEQIKRKQRKFIDSLEVVNNALHNEEILWLARALYSETNRKIEMRYVAWVIRNRVEVEFNGRYKYKDVILDPKQFSAFNRGRSTRYKYMNLEVKDIKDPVTGARWFHALEVANHVIDASPIRRPFPKNTLYFYSEISMPEYKPHPEWRNKYVRVYVDGINPYRFRFFANPKHEEKKRSIFSADSDANQTEDNPISETDEFSITAF